MAAALPGAVYGAGGGRSFPPGVIPPFPVKNPCAPAVWLHTYGTYLLVLFSCVSQSTLHKRIERNILPGWFHLPSDGSDAAQNI